MFLIRLLAEVPIHEAVENLVVRRFSTIHLYGYQYELRLGIMIIVGL